MIATPLCVITSSRMDHLCERYFLPSFQRLDDPQLDLHFLRMDSAGCGNGVTSGHSVPVNDRFERAAEVLTQLAAGQAMIVADVDIVFLNRFRERLLQELGDADIALMDDRPEGADHEIDFGFFVVRRTVASIDFLRRLGANSTQVLNTHDIVHESGIRFRKLSHCFVNTDTSRMVRRADVMLFHAKCAAGLPGVASILQKESLLQMHWNERLRKEIVVARHEEDLTWLSQVDCPAIVYDKSPDPNKHQDSVRLVNFGREAHTYLHHIIYNYERLADWTIFVQGDPSQHHPSLGSALASEFTDAFVPLSDDIRTDNRDGEPNHFGLNLAHAAHALFGCEGDYYRFPAGAQFAVHRNAIRARSIEWYETAFQYCIDEEMAPWRLERLWPRIFGRPWF